MSWSAESRLAEKIRARVANVVLFELQDPRIHLVTITRVRLKKDLSVCTVYYSVLGTEGQRSRTAHALRDAAGFVRREVAKVLRTRVTPQIAFQYDDAIEGGFRMSALLKQLEEERGTESETEGETGEDESAVVDPDGSTSPEAPEEGGPPDPTPEPKPT